MPEPGITSLFESRSYPTHLWSSSSVAAHTKYVLSAPVRYDSSSLVFQDVFPDKATERKILSFTIKCPSEGCEWTGELRSKEVKSLLYSMAVKKKTTTVFIVQHFPAGFRQHFILDLTNTVQVSLLFSVTDWTKCTSLKIY